MSNDRELHWYQFAILYHVGGVSSYMTVSCGFVDQKVTMARMAFARENAKAPADALVLSATYLGLMTLQEFEG